MRCTNCSIQYPPEMQQCVICDGRLWAIYKSGPDADWKERVAASLGEGVYAPTIAYTTPHKADVTIPLHLHDGRMWLPHKDLIEEGSYVNLESGSVVYVNTRFYELQGRSRKRGDMWWVEEIVTEGAFDDMTPEDIING